MSPLLKKFETQAMKLPVKDRALLAEHLIESLDEIGGAEVERLWLEEADRRYRAYKQGRMKARPAAAVFRQAYSRFK